MQKTFLADLGSQTLITPYKSINYGRPDALNGVRLHAYYLDANFSLNEDNEYIAYKLKSSPKGVISCVGKEKKPLPANYFKSLKTGKTREVITPRIDKSKKREGYTWTSRNHNKCRHREMVLLGSKRWFLPRSVRVKMFTLHQRDGQPKNDYLRLSKLLLDNLRNRYSAHVMVYGYEPYPTTKDGRSHMHVMALITDKVCDKLFDKNGGITKIQELSLLYGEDDGAIDIAKRNDRNRSTYVSKAGKDTLELWRMAYVSSMDEKKGEKQKLVLPCRVSGHYGFNVIKELVLKDESLNTLVSYEIADRYKEGEVFMARSDEIMKYHSALVAQYYCKKQGIKCRKADRFIEQFKKHLK